MVIITAFTQLHIFRYPAFVRWENNYKTFIFTIIYFITIHALIQYNTILIKYKY